MKYQIAYSYCDAMDMAEKNDIAYYAELIYVGSYFCDKYFCRISENSWDTVFRKIESKHKSAVLVIPTPSQNMLAQTKKNVDKLILRYSDIITDIVVNDFAMLRYASEAYNKKIWCGRTMSKEIRDPRYQMDFRSLKLYEHISNGDKFGIDSPIYGIEADMTAPLSIEFNDKLKLGIHFPLAYVTFGRHCEIGSADLPLEGKFRLDNPCKGQCEKSWIAYSDGEFYKYGRAVYCENSKLVGKFLDNSNVRIIESAVAEKIKRTKV